MAVSTIRVLVVVDDPGEARLVESALEQAGRDQELSFMVARAETLAAGLDAVQAAPPDVALVDLSLPDASGIETVSRFRERAAHVPLILLHSSDDGIMGSRAVREGAQDYLLKGDTSPGHLCRAIRYAVERARSAAELKASEERYRLFVEGSPGVFYYVHAPDHRFLYLSSSVAGVTGYTPEEMLGKPYDDFLTGTPTEQEKIHQRTASVVRREQELAVYTSMTRHKSGRPIPIELVESPVIQDGRVVAVRGFARDITERYKAEAALRESERTARAFVDNSPYGIFRSHRDGTILDANAAMAHMLGYASSGELLSRNMSRDIWKSESDRRRAIELALSNDGRVAPRDCEWRRADGSIVVVRLTGLAARGEDGDQSYWHGYVEDVTPLRQAEAALRHGEKLAAVGQLVSGVAHELNNPLAAILLFVDMLLEDERFAGEEETLHVIRQQAQRSRAIVRDLLAFAGDHEKHRAPTELEPLINAVIDGLRPQVERLGARLVVDVGCDLGAVLIDRASFEQVMTNLVMNAVQASGRGGVVTVRAVCAATEARIVVEDNGPGIPPEVLRRIFEPFFTTKPIGEGTGLGLSVSLGIVRAVDGELIAENRRAAEGTGARFVVTLPREKTTAVTPATHDTGEYRAAVKPVMPEVARDKDTVLIVDDEDAIRAALGRFFARRGWEVIEAADGLAAMQQLLSPDATTTHFDLVISDLRMPGYSGIELHDQLLAERPEILDRLIFSTGDTASPEAAAFVARTRCEILAKPFTLASLVEMVERVRARARAPAV